MKTCPSIADAHAEGVLAAKRCDSRDTCPYRPPALKTVGALRYYHSRRRAWLVGFNAETARRRR
jgi:hypothetical protein